MTRRKKEAVPVSLLTSLGASSLELEVRKSRAGAVMLISGVIGVGELSDREIMVLSHSGRLIIRGERLAISTLERRSLEIYGRVTEVVFGYGKA